MRIGKDLNTPQQFDYELRDKRREKLIEEIFASNGISAVEAVAKFLRL